MEGMKRKRSSSQRRKGERRLLGKYLRIADDVRTLGKKIITEDEMMAKDADSPGAAVRRLVRG